MRTKTLLSGRLFALLACGALLSSACVTTRAKPPPPPPPVSEAPLPPPPPPEVPLAQRLVKAKDLFDAHKYDDARAQCAKVLDKDPKNLDALRLTAFSYDLQGNLDQAIAGYKQVLEIYPIDEGALLNLGALYRRREQYDAAIALYTHALRQKLPAEEAVKLRNNLGVIYRLDKKYDLAEATLRKVLERTPGNVDTYKNMALLFYDENRLPLAEEFSIEAQNLAKKQAKKGVAEDSGIWNNLGLIHFKMDGGKPARAMADFHQAATLNPNDEAAQMNIGAIAMRYRDYDTAQKSFAKATELKPNDPAAFEEYAFALSGAHEDKEALAAFKTATQLYGHDKCEIAWQEARIHKFTGTNIANAMATAQGKAFQDALGHYTTEWKADLAALQRYQAMTCHDEATKQVESDLKTAQYMAANPPAPMAPPPPPPPLPPVPKAPPAKTSAPATAASLPAPKAAAAKGAVSDHGSPAKRGTAAPPAIKSGAKTSKPASPGTADDVAPSGGTKTAEAK